MQHGQKVHKQPLGFAEKTGNKILNIQMVIFVAVLQVLTIFYNLILQKIIKAKS